MLPLRRIEMRRDDFNGGNIVLEVGKCGDCWGEVGGLRGLNCNGKCNKDYVFKKEVGKLILFLQLCQKTAFNFFRKDHFILCISPFLN